MVNWLQLQLTNTEYSNYSILTTGTLVATVPRILTTAFAGAWKFHVELEVFSEAVFWCDASTLFQLFCTTILTCIDSFNYLSFNKLFASIKIYPKISIHFCMKQLTDYNKNTKHSSIIGWSAIVVDKIEPHHTNIPKSCFKSQVLSKEYVIKSLRWYLRLVLSTTTSNWINTTTVD